MSMHTEWDTATDCAVTILEGHDVEADELITAPYVLFLGGAGGGCLAVEGTGEQLRMFAARIANEIAELRVTGTYFICRCCREEIRGEHAVEQHERDRHGGSITCVVSPGQ